MRQLRLWIFAGALLLACEAPLAGQTQANAETSDPAGLSLMQALQSALDNHPVLRIQEEQVNAERAVKQQFTGQFDMVLGSGITQSRFNTPLATSQQRATSLGELIRNQATNLTSYNFTASKLLRSGISGDVIVETSRTADNLFNDLGVNRSRFMFQVNVPLLRGRGREVVAANETASQLEADATLLDLNQLIAELLRDAAASYWLHLAAIRNYEVLDASEQRGKTIVENVQSLIDADRVAPVEINQVKANLADRGASRIAAQQRQVEAQQRLAIAMGLRFDQMTFLPPPADDFPSSRGPVAPETGPDSTQFHIDQAIARRADLLASEKRQDSARVIHVAAANLLRPQVDLTFSSGYSGLKEGRRIDRTLTSLVSGLRGVDAIAGITYEFPPANNFAKGRQFAAEAAVRQADLRYLERARGVTSEVVAALQAVGYSIGRLEKAKESVELFQTALQGERDKLRLGLGSLVDLLTVEDRLTRSLSGLVDAQLAHALALTRLRFVTGTIVAPDQAVQSVDREVFFNLPF